MSVQLYNTLTRSKERLEPLEQGRVRIYACGPTVYNYIHIGNARTFLMADVIQRFLKFDGYDVRFVMNITDIDDNIIKKAAEEDRSAAEVAQTYSEAFLEDVVALGMEMPAIMPRVSDHIPEIIDLISDLIEKKFAYVADGSVYYRVNCFSNYGKLSGKKKDELIAGARVEVDERKADPLDFALWKAAKEGEPSWDSPWGGGRPGWHIECSAMAIKQLGEQIDIHMGGTDLIFPHHENEIAQSEACTGKPFAKYWMHMGFLNIDNEKMSKSKGNFWLARDILKRFGPEAIRLFFLQTLYRHPLNFSEEALADADAARKRLDGAMRRARTLLQDTTEQERSGTSPHEEEIDAAADDLVTAMRDDFNTAAAMGKIFELTGLLNRLLATDPPGPLASINRIYELVLQWNTVLGILSVDKIDPSASKLDEVVALLIDLRQQLRQKKEFEMADRIRDDLTRIGIVLEDTADGTTWHIAS